MLLTALRAELIKLYRRPSLYLAFAVILVVVVLVALGAGYMERRIGQRATRHALGGDFLVHVKVVNGPFIASAVMLPCIPVLLPLLVSVVAGGQIAGERTTGVLRTVLSRPVSRAHVFAAKFAVSALHSVVLAAALGVIALVVGLIWYGGGGLVVVDRPLREFGVHDTYVRLGLAYAIAAWGLIAVASLSLMFSALLRNPTAAAGMAVAFVVACVIASPIFQEMEWDFIPPYLLSEQLLAFRQAAAVEINAAELARSLAVLGGYIVIPFLIGLAVFQRRDVLC